MKTGKFAASVAMFAATVAGAAYWAAPGFRQAVDRQVAPWKQWTPEARAAAPVQFADHAEGQLTDDLAAMKETRAELFATVGKLADNIRQQQAQLAQAGQFADEFRTAFREDEFPVIIRNAAYGKEDMVQQVSMLLAEAQGCRASIEHLEGIRKQAEEQLEDLTVRINRTQAQLVALDAQGKLLRARELNEDGEQLAAQVNELLDGNRQVIQGCVVRSVAELIAAVEPKAEPRPTLSAAQEFLTVASKPEATCEEVQPVSFEEPAVNGVSPVQQEVIAESDEGDQVPVTKKSQRVKVRGKLIFEQD